MGEKTLYSYLISMPHISEQKQELRTAILERIRHLNEQSRAAESRTIVRRILDILPHDKAVCAYVPLQSEPDIRPLLFELLAQQRSLYLPSGGAGTLFTMRRIEDLSRLVTGQTGIPEPGPDAPLLPPSLPVVALIPGRAFDAACHRLGRGNGGYDRWMNERRKTGETLCYGVAFECQIVPQVPVEDHDATLDGVITGRGLLEQK